MQQKQVIITQKNEAIFCKGIVDMMLYILFMISIFYGNSKILSAENSKKLRPNRSSEEFNAANLLRGFPRIKSQSKSPSSRSSSTARKIEGSPKFYTPSHSPISTAQIHIDPAEPVTSVQPKPNIPSNFESWDDVLQKDPGWDDASADFDRIKHRNGTTHYSAKAHLRTNQKTLPFVAIAKILQTAKTETASILLSIPNITQAAAQEITAIIAEVPKVLEEFKNKTY